MEYRVEEDFLGKKEIPKDAYYGVQTARAKENFNISGKSMSSYTSFIKAMAQVKKACAIANYSLYKLDENIKDAICSACDDIIDGKYHSEFIIDPIQGGAGTSVNMNANEVIANRALEILGHEKGSYDIINPNNHVNLSQSTNDVYPTAFRMALYEEMITLEEYIAKLRASFHKKSLEFAHIVKMGRTQLQDAVPMTLGQEFKTYYTILGEDLDSFSSVKEHIKEINLGGTAIGTGINSHREYANLVKDILQDVTKRPFKTASDLVSATQNTGVFVEISASLKKLAVRVSKICSDLRLLSSGPRAGLNEINLPPMQPGSSIMPGKVNPVIPEVVNQIAFQVIGNDITVTLASENGQLQLNVFEPIIVYNLFESINMLCRGFETLSLKCIDGITANEEHCRDLVLNSISLVTALSPIIGYQKCSEVAREALNSNRSIGEVVLEKGYMSKEELDKALILEDMVEQK